MLEELQRRNDSAITTRNYLRVVSDFAKHFGKSPPQRTSNLSSLHTLRHSCGRTFTRSPSMGPPTLSFLLTRKGPQPRLWRQVPRRPETSSPSQPTLLRRSGSRSRRETGTCNAAAESSPALAQLSTWQPTGVQIPITSRHCMKPFRERGRWLYCLYDQNAHRDCRPWPVRSAKLICHE